MSDIDVNKIQQNVKELQDQNAIDFQQWKKLGNDIEKLSEKIKLSDTNLNMLMKKIKNDYNNMKKLIMNENVQVQLNNKIEENKNDILDSKIKIDNNKNEINKKVNIENFEVKVDEINSQINDIDFKKANQSSINNLKNQLDNLVIKANGTSNAEVVQARVMQGFTYKNLDNRLINIESLISDGKFTIDFFDLVNKAVSPDTGDLNVEAQTRITTNSKYNIAPLNELYLRINKLASGRILFNNYFFDENEKLISPSLITSIKSETNLYYEYKIDISKAHYMRLLFKFENDSNITENDIYENVILYFYNNDRINNMVNQLNQMCYDSLGNKFTSPGETIKDISKIVAHNKNIFNKLSNENVVGYISSNVGGIYNDNPSYKTSHFIRGLEENEKYIITPKIRKFLAYDKNNKPIQSSYVDENISNYIFTVESNWASIRFTYFVNDEDSLMLAKGDEPQQYTDYGYVFGKNVSFNDFQVNQLNNIINNNSNKFANKILFNFGDSIAAGDGNNGKGYGKLFATKYNMICYDFAVGGATLGETDSNNITTQITNAISKSITPNYILIEGLANDIASYNVPIGNLTSSYNGNYDKTTTAGGLEWIIYTLKTNYPSAKIAFVSVHKMSSRDYAKQVERQGLCVDVCKKWSIPIIDIFNRGNLNTFLPEYHKFTHPTESQPNGDRTHPNQLGYDTFYLPLIYETLYFI